jgi:hypothetical protein
LSLVGVLLAVALVGAVAVLATVARWEYEPQSAAEHNCEGLVPPDAADSAARGACLDRELHRSSWGHATPLLAVSALAGVIAFGLVVIAARGSESAHG